MISEVLRSEIDRLETQLESLDLFHTLLGRGIVDARATLSAIKAELGQAGQPELPLEPPPATAKP